MVMLSHVIMVYTVSPQALAADSWSVDIDLLKLVPSHLMAFQNAASLLHFPALLQLPAASGGSAGVLDSGKRLFCS